MKKLECLFTVTTFICLALRTYSQDSIVANSTANTTVATSSEKFFEGDTIPAIALTGNIRELLKDRGEISKFHKMKLVYEIAPGIYDTADVDAKTRGHFRKMSENCTYPPLLIDFSDSMHPGSHLFGKNDKIKFVMPCKDENYVVREWMVYKLYNLFTPVSLQARLVKLTLADPKKEKPLVSLLAIVLESEKEMAKRNDMLLINRQLKPADIEQQNFLTLALFQYLIGNTDWSVEYGQNIVLMLKDSGNTAITMPYDFDHSALVHAPYAQPAPELRMNSILERRYRGACLPNISFYDPIIAQFNWLKPQIYALYTNCKLVDDKYKNFVIKYLDEFYTILNNPASFKKEILYPCDKDGTGNVIIKGMRKQ